MSMSLRNEHRSLSDNPTLISEGYKCAYWYTNVVTASDLIKKISPDVLIFLSVLGYDIYITLVPTGASLGDKMNTI